MLPEEANFFFRLELQDGHAAGRLARNLWVDTLDAEIERSARGVVPFCAADLFQSAQSAPARIRGLADRVAFVSSACLSGDFSCMPCSPLLWLSNKKVQNSQLRMNAASNFR
ncbi:MAG: hypothetical protein C4519_23265 [Desulfobacteraceae bacterium]|nr:MAG: hypothetical protein C4519_23265 [Desulfobacteraceae bacterium]